MQLYWSPTSPFVRKVLVVAHIHGLADEIELLRTDPMKSARELTDVNPLSKIPALVSREGAILFDSPVICEYLDCIAGRNPLFPSPGPARWSALKMQALGDGIMDAAVYRRQAGMRPSEIARQAAMERQAQLTSLALDQLELHAPELNGLSTIGEIAIACALSYLDFRFQDQPWRPGRLHLTRFYEEVEELPAMAATRLE